MENRSTLSVIVALLGMLSQCLTHLTPRITFSIGSPGRHLTRFSNHDVGNTTTLLLSEAGDMLYVGARDAVLALDVSHEDVITLRNKLDWSPSDKDLEQCSMKGKNIADCPNFIRVLQFLNSSHIYACGTFAFSPRCTYVNSESLTMSMKPDEGRGRCPYDPYQRNTAIIVDGELYTGTVADYRGNRPVISRHLSESRRVDLKLDDTLGWLEDPTFISSSYIPDEEKIYFFFSEVGREYDFIDKFIVSRVSQICMSDVGGQRTLQRRWTTFAKAQLLCQADNELPYNVLQDIDTLPPAEGVPADETLFYGIFTSQWSVNSGHSAVCSFRLSDIRAVFSGNYKVLNRDTLQWSTRVQEKVANPGECGLHNASDNALRFIKENFLADDSVRPIDRHLTMVSTGYKYSHLTAQRVQAANNKNYTVLFLLTESGYLHKAVVLQSGAHIVEEVQVFEQPQPVKSLKLSIPKGMIYVGTSEGVMRVPTANCSFYWTCAQCVLARDPFCGWDTVSRTCVETSNTQISLAQDVDTGNVKETCDRGTFTNRVRFDPNEVSAGELVSVALNEVVRLRCPAASHLSQQLWERPNSQLSSDLYLHLGDGGLSFVATPATLGHYLCLSIENGYQQTMAIYHVKQKSGPLVQTTSSYTALQTLTAAKTQAAPSPSPGLHSFEFWPLLKKTMQGDIEPTVSSMDTTPVPRQRGLNLTVWTPEPAQTETDVVGGELLHSAREPCYLKELVVVSVLLVLCISLTITMFLYVVRLHCRSRTVPHTATPSRNSDRRTPVEHEAPRRNQLFNKSNRHSPHSGQACGSGCNGALTEDNPLHPLQYFSPSSSITMAHNDKDPVPVVGNLSPGQLQSLLKMEPKTLGAIQIVIGALILCLSASVLQVHEVHFTGDIALFLVVVVQVTLSGSVLVHSGRRPTLFWVKCMLVLHLISAAFATAALGLMSKHLPYRQSSYHCEHCRKLELHAVLLIDGILVTLVIFLVLELLICITAMLFGLSVLAAGGAQTRSQRPVYPQTRPPAVPAVPAVQAAPAAAEPSQVAVVVTEPDSEQLEELSTPPTEPQVEPI